MAGDLETALAFVSRREGTRAMAASRWAHVISLDLGWMPPGDARAFVGQAVEAALLRLDGEELRVTFDPAAVEIPRGFKPGPVSRNGPAAPRPGSGVEAPAVAPAPPPVPVDPFLDWVDRVAQKGGHERRVVLEQVAALQGRMGGSLSALAAVLWLASRAGMDVREAAAAVKV